MMIQYDYSLLCSGLLNVLAFLYGVILMITKSIYRKHTLKVARGVELIAGSEAPLAHTTTKATINILSSLALVSLGVYAVLSSEICYNPYFEYDQTIASVITLLLTICVFNLVLTLLTETITVRNIHEVPMYIVKALVSVAILLRKEGAVAGVSCLFLFGSVLADEILNLAYATSKKQKHAWAHILQLSMHLLCNFLFPAILVLASVKFSKRNLLQMGNSAIVIFFFTATFLIICNVWRLVSAWRNIVEKTKERKSGKSQEEWRANAISATVIPMLNNKGIIQIASTLPNPYTNEVVKDAPANYLTIDELEKENFEKEGVAYLEGGETFDGKFEEINSNVAF